MIFFPSHLILFVTAPLISIYIVCLHMVELISLSSVLILARVLLPTHPPKQCTERIHDATVHQTFASLPWLWGGLWSPVDY